MKEHDTLVIHSDKVTLFFLYHLIQLIFLLPTFARACHDKAEKSRMYKKNTQMIFMYQYLCFSRNIWHMIGSIIHIFFVYLALDPIK